MVNWLANRLWDLTVRPEWSLAWAYPETKAFPMATPLLPKPPRSRPAGAI